MHRCKGRVLLDIILEDFGAAHAAVVIVGGGGGGGGGGCVVVIVVGGVGGTRVGDDVRVCVCVLSLIHI